MTPNRLSGLMFLGIGLWACWAAVGMSLGSLQSPGPGFYPLILGIAIAVLGVVLMGEGIVYARARGNGAVAAFRSPHARTVVAAALALLAYAALLPPLGFGLATFLLLIVFLALGRMRLGLAALVSVILVAGTLLAAKALNIALPAGSLFP